MERDNVIQIKPLEYKCKCNETILIYTHLLAKYCVCPGCQSYYRKNGDKFEYLDTKHATDYVQVISIGKKCTIEEVEYIVTGYAVKSDRGYDYQWREYTLYNPMNGYTYLSEYNGHWMMVSLIDYVSTVGTYDTEKLYTGEMYHLYSKYKCKVITAAGEFAVDVYADKNINYHEFIAPPRILIHEAGRGEANWLHGKYIEPSEVKGLFALDAMPDRHGIGMIEPQPVRMPFISVMRISVVAAIALVVLFIVSCYMSADRLVYSYSNGPDDYSRAQIVTPSFDLTGASKNLELKLQTDVDNSWVEADITLVNEKTADDVDLVMGVEYYHGYSEGESWSEGSASATEVIEQVPAGRYHLLITASKDVAVNNVHYDVQVRRDVPVWGSFILSMLLLSIVPVVQFYRERSFEKDRWMESNYSPFEEEE